MQWYKDRCVGSIVFQLSEFIQLIILGPMLDGLYLNSQHEFYYMYYRKTSTKYILTILTYVCFFS